MREPNIRARKNHAQPGGVSTYAVKQHGAPSGEMKPPFNRHSLLISEIRYDYSLAI